MQLLLNNLDIEFSNVEANDYCDRLNFNQEEKTRRFRVTAAETFVLVR